MAAQIEELYRDAYLIRITLDETYTHLRYVVEILDHSANNPQPYHRFSQTFHRSEGIINTTLALQQQAREIIDTRIAPQR
ncbi:hypothetical protein [Burkholderia pseudomultivorans]|uniref:hypothetical protein n=1 Tax=Burkholderia pseudomultivorans TaxID=1207504 RepID=UPI00075B6447|nr:hypothetical protein [Burkholderia pseudomultivorans]KVC19729.1 hypothetical protein WS55_22715 [Burkholderia pseudomultivorans]KVC32080.1 hypothetical protein WS56_14320 [Burkholderia pseudomultivorans]